jgi:hypothetical protein
MSNIFIYLQVIMLILCYLFDQVFFSPYNAFIFKGEKKSYYKTNHFFDLLVDFHLIAV